MVLFTPQISNTPSEQTVLYTKFHSYTSSGIYQILKDMSVSFQITCATIITRIGQGAKTQSTQKHDLFIGDFPEHTHVRIPGPVKNFPFLQNPLYPADQSTIISI